MRSITTFPTALFPKRRFKSGMLFASPTVGKTTMSLALVQQGVRVIDSDDIVRSLAPGWLSNRLWNGPPPSWAPLMYDIVVEYMLLALARAPKGSLAVLSNLTSLASLDLVRGAALPFEKGSSIPYFARRAADIEAISTERGDPIPLSQAKSWTQDDTWEGLDPRFKVCVLEAGVYLSDVIDFSAWRPSAEERALAYAVARLGATTVVSAASPRYPDKTRTWKLSDSEFTAQGVTMHQDHKVSISFDAEGVPQLRVREKWLDTRYEGDRTLPLSEVAHLLLNITDADVKRINDAPQDAMGTPIPPTDDSVPFSPSSDPSSVTTPSVASIDGVSPPTASSDGASIPGINPSAPSPDLPA